MGCVERVGSEVEPARSGVDVHAASSSKDSDSDRGRRRMGGIDGSMARDDAGFGATMVAREPIAIIPANVHGGQGKSRLPIGLSKSLDSRLRGNDALKLASV